MGENPVDGLRFWDSESAATRSCHISFLLSTKSQNAGHLDVQSLNDQTAFRILIREFQAYEEGHVATVHIVRMLSIDMFKYLHHRTIYGFMPVILSEKRYADVRSLCTA